MPSKKQEQEPSQSIHPIFKPGGVELLLKVKQELLAHPERFDMADWFWADGLPPRGTSAISERMVQKLLSESLDEGRPVCGSTACIAGHMAIMGGFRDWRVDSENVLRLQNWCRNKLFNNPEESIPFGGLIPLFYLGMWPVHLRHRYMAAVEDGNKTGCAEAAAAAIDFFLYDPHGFRYALIQASAEGQGA